MKGNVAVFLLAFAALARTTLSATDYVPTRYDDPPPGSCLPSDCSLREAIIAANADAAADRVLLSAGEYQLTIPGAGELFSATGSIDIREELELRGPGATMTRIVAGGLGDRAVVVASADATIVGLTVALADQQGLLVASSASADVQDCLFTANGTGIAGNPGSFVLVSRSALVGNGADGAFFSQNLAFLQNVTSSGNQHGVTFSEMVSAGACGHCTLADNTASALRVTASVVQLAASVLRGQCQLDSGEVLSFGGNIEQGSNSCELDHVDDHPGATGLELLLGNLGDFGGPTPSYRPLPASIAVDAASQCTTPEDQRGAPRDFRVCDSGAVEREHLPPTPVFHDGFEQGNAGAWSTLVP